MTTPADPTAPYAGFGGTVGKIFATSEPDWTRPPTVRSTSKTGTSTSLTTDTVWNARVFVDGLLVGEGPGLVMLMGTAPFQGIDVGIDRRSPVSWDVFERHGPFPYTGHISGVTYTPGASAPDAGAQWIDYLRQVGTRYE